MLRLRFLGETRVERDGEALVLPPSKKTRGLLAYLAVTGRAHRRERLCSLLWELPDDPRAALRWSLSRIRTLVDEPGVTRIVADRESVRFDAQGAEVDLLDLRRTAAEDIATASTEQLTSAAATSGEFLEGLDMSESRNFHAWYLAEREEARAARTRILSSLVERLRPQPEQALPHARALLDLQSDREEAWAGLIQLLLEAGRRREAEEQHEFARRVLEDAGAPASGPLLQVWRTLRAPPPGDPAAALPPIRPGGDSRTAADTPEGPAVVGPSGAGSAAASARILSFPIKPSIAVLPFTNMSNDPADEPFADGLTEDLITDLSRNAGLFVIARNSTFVYKGKSVDVRRISEDLGVRYVLEGSARRAAGRVRINAQLIDASGGEHLWADRYDRTLEDVFAVQDEVTAKIVEALIGRLAPSTPRQRPRSLEAHELCVRARVLTEETPQTAREACLLLRRAIELEPDYAEAHGMLAYNRWLAWTHFGEPEEPNRATAVAFAERAVALDPDDAGCRYFLGTILAYERRWPESDAEFAAALERDPNHADTWAALSDMSVLGGRVEDGLEEIRKAFRLNPYPAVWYYDHLGQAQYAARDYEAAVATLRKEETYRTNSRRFLAASLAQLGRLDEARREVEMFLVTHPHFTIGHWVSSQPLRDAATRAHFVEGFRKAGLPE